MSHEMLLDSESEGTEEWYCPFCGKRMLIEWNPWRKVVINIGDISSFHRINKGGLKVSAGVE